MAAFFKRHRATKVATLTICLSFAAFALLSWLFPQPPIHLGRENGTYSNKRCGKITFNYGVVSGGNWKTNYVAQKDKEGLFALPDNLIGVKRISGMCEVILDTYGHPLFLRFDDAYYPKTVKIFGVDNLEDVTFTRHEGISR